MFVKAWLQTLETTLSCEGSSFSLHQAPPALPSWRYQQSHKKQMAHNYLLLALALSRHRAGVPRTETSSAWQTSNAFSLHSHYQ